MGYSDTLRPVLAAALIALAAGSLAQAGAVLSFDGSDDRVTVPYDVSFPTEIFTAGAWIRLAPPGHTSAIIARGEDDDSFDLVWHLYVRPDGILRLMVEESNMQNHCYPQACQNNGTTAGCTINGSLFVADDLWHHVAVSRDAAGFLAMYIDGQTLATCTNTATPSPDNAQDLTIGCTHGTIGPPPGGEEPPIWFFPGLIDEPAMWNVALTSSEIGDVLANGVNPGSPGLVGFWTFDEGAGQVVSDLSPAGNHGFRGDSSVGDSADPEWLVTSSSPGRVPDGADVPGTPLRLGKNATDRDDLDLTWSPSCSLEADDYSIHEGEIGTFYSHTMLMCTTGGVTGLRITPDAGDRYYLVVPLDSDAEGSYGTDSGELERPASTTACRTELILEACP